MKRAAMVMALLLGGCAFSVPGGTPGGAPDRAPAGAADKPALRILADADANGRRPVALDVVRVADPEMARRLDGLDAAAWFRTRTALVKESAGRLAVTSWEMVPGQTVQLHSLPPFAATPAATPVATVIFAHYATPGLHRRAVPGAPALEIRLERDGFTAQPNATGETP
ncbi:hypothetical protein [Azospirillum canadense]|uniref:hypothetical protein n=1 Tax=Azospirillum canadense TaxID=403962 RepID=UPI0022268A00|nr:hypothetical protein [Azospirillum canadense]MCW2241055.1 type VI secretion system protein [Azospirillum canadense]